MRYVKDMRLVESAPDWLLSRLCDKTNENIIKIATVLWGMWLERNKRVWENKHVTPDVTIDLSYKQIVDWQEAAKRKKECLVTSSSTVSSGVVQWQAPQPGWLKLNADASLFNAASSFTVGMVLRDEYGTFICGKNMRLPGQVTVMEAEAAGVLEALKWIEESGRHHVMVESDSMLVVNALQNSSVYHVEVGNILDSCLLN